MTYSSSRFGTASFRVAVVVAVLLRFMIGMHMPLDAYSAVRSPFDDLLMVQYAQLDAHFHPATDWDQAFALVKTMSFPYFLNLIGLLGIPYRAALTALYCLGAYACVAGMRRLLSACGPTLRPNRWVWLGVFVFLAYCPAAFDYDAGSKIYREPMLVPAVMLLAGLMLIYVASCWKPRGDTALRQWSGTLAWGVLLGGVWSFYWYVKESGIWLAPLLLMTLVSCGVLVFLRCRASYGKGVAGRAVPALLSVVVVLVPLGVFGGSVAAYRAVNERYFGVSYASIRTEGEIAGFFSRLYTVASDERTDGEWVPWSVVEKAQSVSPTLRAHPRIVEWMAKGQFGSAPWAENPPDTDMGVWTLIWDLAQSGEFGDQRSVQDLFARINGELDAADLPQSKGFRPSKSVAPKTLRQVWALHPSWWMSFRTSALWRHYEVRSPDSYACDTAHELNCRLLETTLAESLPRQGESGVAWRGTGLATGIAGAIIRVYQAAALLYLPLGALGFLVAAFTALRRRDGMLRRVTLAAFVFAVGAVGSVAALMLATSWVTYPEAVEAMIHHAKYYTAAAAPLIQLTAIMGIGLLALSVSARIGQSGTDCPNTAEHQS